MLCAGASALSQLLRYDPPEAEERLWPCPCGQQARYREMRSRRILTALGSVQLTRPYYLCEHCHHGQFPADLDLDVSHYRSFSRRAPHAGAGRPTGFVRRSDANKCTCWPGLDLTTKSVERTAEDIGADIAGKEQLSSGRSHATGSADRRVGEPIPVLYIEMDGTGVPVVKAETEGRQGKIAGQPAHTREAKLGCIFTQTTYDEEGYAIRDPDSTTYVGSH